MSEETILFCLATFGAIAPPILVRGFRQNRSPKLDARQANSRPISSPWTGWCLKKSSADLGGPAPPEGTVSYFYERADVVGD
jgi:hypothetical protein